MLDRVNDFIVPDHTTTMAASEGKLPDKTGMFLSVWRILHWVEDSDSVFVSRNWQVRCQPDPAPQ